MEKEITKNRQATEMTLITAVNDIIEESGFEGLGINAVAAKAKVSKMLIYRYFNSLDGLIAAYIQQNDYWINFDEELPDQAHLATFIKQIFKRQIMWLRENYTLKRLYRWELTTDNKFVKELRNKREEKGIWLVEAVSKLSKHPKKEIAAMASIITAAISYLALLEENCPVYNGLKIQQESGWEELEEGINLLVVSKMLIYRYFNSLDGLIAAYIQQNDYWINFDEELPDQAHLATFIKQIFKRQIMWLRENYTLKRLYRWELTTDNKFVKELRNKREEKGIWLVEAVSKLSKHPKKEIAAMASIITAAISYLALLEENCPVYNGLKIQQESGWEELEEGINLLVDLWLQKQL